jgi:integrase
MNRSSSANSDSVARFLRTQRFRDQETTRIYGHILRAFYNFVCKYSPGPLLSVSDLQRWLREKQQKWPLHMVCYRARVVERFLEWSHTENVISINPFAELHRHYGPRTYPIVRALVSEDFEAALTALCPSPRFGSFLGRLMAEHVELMRSLGYRYEVNERMLLRFDRFLQNRPALADQSLNQLIAAWEQSHASTSRTLEARKVRRLLSKAMHRLDPSVPILPRTVKYPPIGQQQRTPHVYSDEEIQRIFKAALSLPSPKAPLRPLALYTMTALAYCAGLRVREIVSLTIRDINLQDGTIEIRETKFFKYRRLPLAANVLAAVKDYLGARQEAGAPTNPESHLFWNQKNGRRYSFGGVRILLVGVLRRAGLKPSAGRRGPRIHDLRHTMASHRLRNWYEEGINPESKLPYLATYLGHEDISSTLVYLHITPELMHTASERFRKKGAAALAVKGGSL